MRGFPKICLIMYEEACRSFRVCERMLRNFVARGELSIIRFGGHTVSDPADLEALKHAKKSGAEKKSKPMGKNRLNRRYKKRGLNLCCVSPCIF